MAKKNSQFIGRWQITSMTEWDQDFVDEDVPGYINFVKDRLGDCQFGYVRCDIVEMEPCSGRGGDER